MKIDPTRPVGAAAPGRRAAGAGAEGFSLPATAETRPPAPAAPVGALGAAHAVMALQMDFGGRRQRQARRGAAALDALDKLQAGLLGGADSARDLEDLAAQYAQREPSGDDGLDDVLREIDVRAAVELAKRERRGAVRA